MAARSAPALGSAIEAVTASLSLEWGPVARDLATRDGTRLRLSNRLLSALRARLKGATGPDEAVGIAFAAVAELAHLTGDALRAGAQARLAALPPAAQEAALNASREADAAAGREPWPARWRRCCPARPQEMACRISLTLKPTNAPIERAESPT